MQDRFNFKLENPVKVAQKIEAILLTINKKDQLTEFDELALKNIHLKKDMLSSNTVRFEELALPSDHLVHGDYLESNVFFDDSDHVSRVFDFEKTGYSPRTYELFRSMTYGLLSEEYNEKDMRKIKLYVDSYSNIYPISNDEIKRGLQLFQLKAIHGFWVEGEHYLSDNTRVDELLSNDYFRIKYLQEHFSDLKKALMK